MRKADLIQALRAAGVEDPPPSPRTPPHQNMNDNKERKTLESLVRRQGIQNYADMDSAQIIKAMHDQRQAKPPPPSPPPIRTIPRPRRQAAPRPPPSVRTRKPQPPPRTSSLRPPQRTYAPRPPIPTPRTICSVCSPRTFHPVPAPRTDRYASVKILQVKLSIQ